MIVGKRVFKTKEAIYSAMLSVLKDKEIDKITISDIANKAKISRKTFYSHYSGIHMLIGDVIETYAKSIEDYLMSIDLIEAFYSKEKIKTILTFLLKRDEKIIELIFMAKERDSLIYRLGVVLKTTIQKTLKEKYELQEDLLQSSVSYVISGIFAVYRDYYLQNKSQKSFNEMIDNLSNLTIEGTSGIYKKFHR